MKLVFSHVVRFYATRIDFFCITPQTRKIKKSSFIHAQKAAILTNDVSNP